MEKYILAILLLIPLTAKATNFPGTLSSDSNLYIAVNNCGATLTSALNASNSTVNVNSAACFPTVGYITIENEAILCSGKTATSLTGCTRGADGTTATSHANGRTVWHTFVAQHHNGLKDEIIGIESYFLSDSQVHISTTSGNVGIGTSVPTSKLDVRGQLRLAGDSILDPTPIIRLSTNTSTGWAYEVSPISIIGRVNGTQTSIMSSTYFQIFKPFYVPAGTAGSPSITNVTSQGAGLFWPGSDDLGITANGIEYIRLNDNGVYISTNIGIGTNSPSSKVHVVDGDIQISTTTGSRGIIFQDGTTQTTAASGSGGATFVDYAGPTVSTNASTCVIVIVSTIPANTFASANAKVRITAWAQADQDLGNGGGSVNVYLDDGNAPQYICGIQPDETAYCDALLTRGGSNSQHEFTNVVGQLSTGNVPIFTGASNDFTLNESVDILVGILICGDDTQSGHFYAASVRY